MLVKIIKSNYLIREEFIIKVIEFNLQLKNYKINKSLCDELFNLSQQIKDNLSQIDSLEIQIFNNFEMDIKKKAQQINRIYQNYILLQQTDNNILIKENMAKNNLIFQSNDSLQIIELQQIQIQKIFEMIQQWFYIRKFMYISQSSDQEIINKSMVQFFKSIQQISQGSLNNLKFLINKVSQIQCIEKENILIYFQLQQESKIQIYPVLNNFFTTFNILFQRNNKIKKNLTIFKVQYETYFEKSKVKIQNLVDQEISQKPKVKETQKVYKRQFFKTGNKQIYKNNVIQYSTKFINKNIETNDLEKYNKKDQQHNILAGKTNFINESIFIKNSQSQLSVKKVKNIQIEMHKIEITNIQNKIDCPDYIFKNFKLNTKIKKNQLLSSSINCLGIYQNRNLKSQTKLCFSTLFEKQNKTENEMKDKNYLLFNKDYTFTIPTIQYKQYLKLQ